MTLMPLPKGGRARAARERGTPLALGPDPAASMADCSWNIVCRELSSGLAYFLPEFPPSAIPAVNGRWGAISRIRVVTFRIFFFGCCLSI